MRHIMRHVLATGALLGLCATLAHAAPARPPATELPACQVTARYAEALAYTRDLGLSLYDAKRDLFRGATAHHTSSARVTFALDLMEAIWQSTAMSPARVAALTMEWCQLDPTIRTMFPLRVFLFCGHGPATPPPCFLE